MHSSLSNKQCNNNSFDFIQPEYIFNELNINSAMVAPDHNETLDLVTSMGTSYPVSGYAYTGGGRRITRVEVTTDEGKHWHVAKLNQVERPNDYGMYWCWVWWQFDLPVTELVGAKEIWCRAWDEANNAQPNDPTWNLMGECDRSSFHVSLNC
jgi:nitrate reductase (NAD(P)H)